MEIENVNVQETKGMVVEVDALITYAKGYLVAEGGTTNEGITLNYLLSDSLNACVNSRDKSQGYKFSKSSIPTDRGYKLTHVPGYYHMKCEMGVGSNGSPVLKPIDLDLIKLCSLNLLDLPKEDTVNEAESGRTNSGKANKK